MFAEQGCLVLRRGAVETVLSPGCGGSVVRLTVDRADGSLDLMRAASPAALLPCDPLSLGCFPLIPYSNRIDRGRFSYRGRDVAVVPNRPPMPHPIHGHGWQVPWQVGAVESGRAILGYRHEPDDWPWAYEARQDFALLEDGLRITVGITNTGTGTMPAGLGLHPYFPKPPGTRLTAPVEEVWDNDETMLPLRRTALPPGWDLARGVPMDDFLSDNGFFGWSGRARIDWPSRDAALEIEADPAFGHLIVYAPAGQPWFCVEPVSHMTDALNRPDEPASAMRDLEPGEDWSAGVTFRIA